MSGNTMSAAAQIVGESVQGASHKLINKECQDHHKSVVEPDFFILSAADGHGSDACPYSAEGSRLAVEVFCRIIGEYCEHYRGHWDTLITFLHREGETKIAQSVETEWKEAVLESHATNGREPALTDETGKDAIYCLYGSTLLGLLYAPGLIFSLQFGDGDIIQINDTAIMTLVQPDKMLGVETHSLCRPRAWQEAVTSVRRAESGLCGPCAFMLTTDGFENSFATPEAYQKAAFEYFESMKNYGAEAISEQLSGWLEETSAAGCGDDITLLLAYLP
jgi:hypothetical protein